MAAPTIEQVGARIRGFRLAKDWTQVDLAKALGVAQASVSDWERGARLDHVRLAEIATALGVELVDLLAPAEDPARGGEAA